MGPELIAIVAVLDGIREYGPWLVVVGLLLGIRTGELVLRREYLKMVDDAAAAATKAIHREEVLMNEAMFWRDRYLNESDLSRTAVGALTTPRGRQ